VRGACERDDERNKAGKEIREKRFFSILLVLVVKKKMKRNKKRKRPLPFPGKIFIDSLVTYIYIIP